MGQKKMMINVHEDEIRIALVSENLLVDLHVEQNDRSRTVGNIYRGVVEKVNPSFQAAFVDYGTPKNGFLSLNDLNVGLYKSGQKGRPRIQSLLKNGQPVMVQVLKEGVKEKGAALTTNISIPGRYMVLSPFSDRSGVSRKIENEDLRHKLKDILAGLTGDDNLGVIIRTAGMDRTLPELKRDYSMLKQEWADILKKFDNMPKPGLVHQEPGAVVRVLRDYFSDEVEEVWVDSAVVYQQALEYFKSAIPKHQKRLKLYVGDRSLFSAYKLEEQIEALDSDKVPLKSGGSIVIESTEALVSIDVNSGRSNQESDIEGTALRTNLEAAEEIGRQLRLRNLGGLVVVDFIDMESGSNRAKVEKAVSESLRNDKARTTVGTISQFGLLELSRQRIDMELTRGLKMICPTCQGGGHIPTVNAAANHVLRHIREIAAQGGSQEIHGTLPLNLANLLLNEKRESLSDLEMEFTITIHLYGDPNMTLGSQVILSGKAGDASGPAMPSSRPPQDKTPARAMGSPKPASRNSEEEEAAEPRHKTSSRQPQKNTTDREGQPKQGQRPKDQQQKSQSQEGRRDGRNRGGRGSHQPQTQGEGNRKELPVTQALSNSEEAPQAASAPAPFGNRSGRPVSRPLDTDALPGDAIFQSSHLPQETVPVIPHARSLRPSTFGGQSDDIESGTVLFSSHGGISSPAATQPTSGEPAPEDSPEGKAKPTKGSAKAGVTKKAAAKKGPAKTEDSAAKKPAAKKAAPKKPKQESA